MPDKINLEKQMIAKRRGDMPKKYRKLYDRVVTGKASPREAIKMQCLECFGWVQSEMVKCECYACGLYNYRPYQKPVKSSTKSLGRSGVDELSAEDD